jgi:hypothetical protein
VAISFDIKSSTLILGTNPVNPDCVTEEGPSGKLYNFHMKMNTGSLGNVLNSLKNHEKLRAGYMDKGIKLEGKLIDVWREDHGWWAKVEFDDPGQAP